MATKYIVDGKIFEDSDSGIKTIVDGHIVEGTAAAAGGAPVLSNATWTNQTTNSIDPRVTVIFS